MSSQLYLHMFHYTVLGLFDITVCMYVYTVKKKFTTMIFFFRSIYDNVYEKMWQEVVMVITCNTKWNINIKLLDNKHVEKLK